MDERDAPHFARQHLHVRHLRGHADHEAVVEEVEVVRLGLAREVESCQMTLLAALRLVIAVRVVKGVDGVDQQPRACERQQSQRDVPHALRTDQMRDALQQHRDHDHADTDRGQHHREDRRARLVERLGPVPRALRVGDLGQPPRRQEIHRGGHAPADQPAGDAIELPRQEPDAEAHGKTHHPAGQQALPAAHHHEACTHAGTVACPGFAPSGRGLSRWPSPGYARHE